MSQILNVTAENTFVSVKTERRVCRKHKNILIYTSTIFYHV